MTTTTTTTTGHYIGGPLDGQDVAGRRATYRDDDGVSLRMRRRPSDGRHVGTILKMADGDYPYSDDQWYERQGSDYVHTTAGGSSDDDMWPVVVGYPYDRAERESRPEERRFAIGGMAIRPRTTEGLVTGRPGEGRRAAS